MELDDKKMEAIVKKVRALLDMAARSTTNEHEAATAALKAQELLEAYNLDMALVNQKANTHAPRKDQKQEGGLYKWQRELWHAVATLNFCKYWYHKGNLAGSVYEHQVLGSHANVVGTEVMAQYLEQAIERLARRWVKENRPGKSVFIKEAIAFREGAASNITNRLWSARYEHIKEQDRKRKEERERNAAMGINTENALVLQDVINTEEDLNNDYVRGWEPGTSARHRKESEARQAAAEAQVAELLRKQAEWDAAHPEEAARRKAAEARKQQEDYARYSRRAGTERPRKPTAEEKRRQLPSFGEGYRQGENVSLNRQIDKETNKRLN